MCLLFLSSSCHIICNAMNVCVFECVVHISECIGFMPSAHFPYCSFLLRLSLLCGLCSNTI